MVTLKKIAEDAGVAFSTVSAVLRGKDYCYVSDAKRKLILDTAEKLGYTPNINSLALRGLPTNAVGVVCSLFTVPIRNKLMSMLVSSLDKNGYRAFLGDSRAEHAREDALLKDFCARGVDGVIIDSSRTETALRAAVPACKVPIINIFGEITSGDGCQMTVDRFKGSYIAAEHLIRCHGRRRLAFYTVDRGSNMRKFEGYRRALHDLAPGAPELLIEAGFNAAGFAKVRDFIKKEKPDAVTASSDTLAVALIRLLHDMGLKVPDDMAVTGFDGLDFTGFTEPSIATVVQPVARLAERVAETLLLSMKSKEAPTGAALLEPVFRPGGSCGCSETQIFSKGEFLSSVTH
jgi:LacI family transcriptional regulator